MTTEYPPMNACWPTRQNWWTAEPALMLAKSSTHDVAAQRRVRAEDRVVADMTVVGDVDVGHEDVAIADRRHAAAAARSAVDRHELAEDVALPDRPGASPRRETSGPAGSARSTRTDRSRCRRRSRSSPRSPPTTPTRQFAPIRTLGPTDACGPIVVPSPTNARGWTIAVGWIWVRSATMPRSSSASATS